MKRRFSALFLLLAAGCSYLPDPTVPYPPYREDRHTLVLTPAKNPRSTAGVLFYPGGLVDPHAYLTMLQRVAESGRGYRVVVAKVPSNLAVLDAGAARSVFAAHPDITNWVIAGHSLGGTMACRWVKNHPGSVRGLVLLAAYPAPADDLSSWPGAVLALYGSADGVLNFDNLRDAQTRLPPGATIANPADVPAQPWGKTTTYVLPGGNHAQFGAYGTQRGDGKPTISREEQHRQTAATLERFLLNLGL